jgi:hypothetical protein
MAAQSQHPQEDAVQLQPLLLVLLLVVGLAVFPNMISLKTMDL